MGCVAIWPVAVPRQHSHKGVAMLCPPVEDFLNSGTKAHKKDVEEVDRSDSVASVSCTTTRVTNPPSMMQDSYMCHWTSGTLLPSQLRWKSKRKQKTKKDLCQCGCCRYDIVFNSWRSI